MYMTYDEIARRIQDLYDKENDEICKELDLLERGVGSPIILHYNHIRRDQLFSVMNALGLGNNLDTSEHVDSHLLKHPIF